MAKTIIGKFLVVLLQGGPHIVLRNVFFQTRSCLSENPKDKRLEMDSASWGADNQGERDAIREQAISVAKLKSINLIGVRKHVRELHLNIR